MDVSNAAINTDRAETSAKGQETAEVQSATITRLSEVKKTSSLTEIQSHNRAENRTAGQQESKDTTRLTRQDVEEMVEALENFANTVQTRLNFAIDDGTEDIVVKILDKETDEVIKQFPAEEILELREKMQDLSGLLLSTNV